MEPIYLVSLTLYAYYTPGWRKAQTGGYPNNIGRVSNNNNGTTPNLASLTYNPNTLIDTIAVQTNSGSALANQQFGYNANLRTTSSSTR